MFFSEKRQPTSSRPLRAKLIFNPNAGRTTESPQQLVDILSAMRDQHILPEVYVMTHPDHQVEEVVYSAVKSGIKLIVVAGGDGTIGSAVGAMVNRNVTLGIIPTGTRNNIAFNLGIGQDISSAVALLRKGQRTKIDVGRVQRGHTRRWFIESAAVGLLTDLYPHADNIQHGNLTPVGEMLATLVNAAPSHLRIEVDGRQRFDTTAHVALIANMAYTGPRFQVSPEISYTDSYLDVFVFSDMGKLNLISYLIQSLTGPVEDPSVKHFRAKQIKIDSDPPMTVLADGVLLGQGALSMQIKPRAIKVMTSTPIDEKAPNPLPINLEVTSDG